MSEDRKHALLSASGASRWLNCTPSARLEDGERTEADDAGSIYAQEGTLAHELAENVLRYITEQDRHVSMPDYALSAEFVAKVESMPGEMGVTVEGLNEGIDPYVNYVLEQLETAEMAGYGKLLLEQKLDLTYFAPESFGTGDAVILSNNSIEIIDLKYGKGVRVYAKDNSQLKLYGLGAVMMLDGIAEFDTVTMTIVQPRLDNITSVTLTVQELLDWGSEFVKPRALQAFAGEGECNTGDWCKWCKVFHKCRAMQDTASVFSSVEPVTLSDAELVEMYNKRKLVASWLDSVESYLEREALQGRKFEGLKLVEGRSVRKWADEIAVIAKLSELSKTEQDAYNVKLKGIGDIEKLVGKKVFASDFTSLLTKPAGAPTLVPDADPRPELEINSAEQVFASAVEEE